MPRYILSLEIEAIRELANYSHWIPMVRGYTREFMDSHHLDWEWNDLVPKMVNRGIITMEPSDGYKAAAIPTSLGRCNEISARDISTTPLTARPKQRFSSQAAGWLYQLNITMCFFESLTIYKLIWCKPEPWWVFSHGRI